MCDTSLSLCALSPRHEPVVVSCFSVCCPIVTFFHLILSTQHCVCVFGRAGYYLLLLLRLQASSDKSAWLVTSVVCGWPCTEREKEKIQAPRQYPASCLFPLPTHRAQQSLLHDTCSFPPQPFCPSTITLTFSPSFPFRYPIPLAHVLVVACLPGSWLSSSSSSVNVRRVDETGSHLQPEYLDKERVRVPTRSILPGTSYTHHAYYKLLYERQ